MCGRKVPIPVYVPPQIKDRVEEIARKEGYSASEWVRRWLRDEAL